LAAEVAIIGMFFRYGMTGSAWGDRSLYTASPLRAFQEQLGVQDPVGFWDPVCFTSDGNVEDFKRRPQTEFKYSRDAMLATVGYIALGITAGLWLPASVYQYQILGRAERLRSHFKGPSSGWAQILA